LSFWLISLDDIRWRGSWRRDLEGRFEATSRFQVHPPQQVVEAGVVAEGVAIWIYFKVAQIVFFVGFLQW
jgi:hypothetical protein